MLCIYVYVVHHVCLFICLSIILSLHLSIWTLEVDGENLDRERDCKEIKLPFFSHSPSLCGYKKWKKLSASKFGANLLTIFRCFSRMPWSSMCRNWALQRLRGVSCWGWPVALQRWSNFKWLDEKLLQQSIVSPRSNLRPCLGVVLSAEWNHYETVFLIPKCRGV